MHNSVSGRDGDVLLGSWNEMGVDDNSGFQPIKTLPAAGIQLIFCIALLVLSFVLPWKYSLMDVHGVSSLSMLIFLQASFWAVILISDAYIRCQHYYSRISGYLEFDIQTKNTRRAPYYVTSIYHVLLLVIVSLLKDYCTNESIPCAPHLALSAVHYIQMIHVFQVLTLIPFIVHYSVKTWRFNMLQELPDAFQDDLTSSRNQINSLGSNHEVGIRTEDKLELLLERQSELIRHLRNHNSKLAKRVLTLSAQQRLL